MEAQEPVRLFHPLERLQLMTELPKVHSLWGMLLGLTVVWSIGASAAVAKQARSGVLEAVGIVLGILLGLLAAWIAHRVGRRFFHWLFREETSDSARAQRLLKFAYLGHVLWAAMAATGTAFAVHAFQHLVQGP
jgi:hypothetical protein